MITRCPICDSGDLFVFLERTSVPVHQNLPLASRAEALAVPRGDLRLACCRRCGFVTNTAFRPELLQYGAGYENDQTFSPRFGEHVTGLVQRLVEAGVRRKFVVEVGCGRGYFLEQLCERGDSRGVGFDPSYQGPDTPAEARVRFVRDYYGAQYSDVKPDVVICRHVIEHVPAPLVLLGAVRAALEGTSRADLAFETPTVEWILERRVIEDFFYEHCSYFSADSLALAFREAGFAPETVERVFGGQYLWLVASHQANSRPPKAQWPGSAAHMIELTEGYRADASRRIEETRERLDALRAAGPLALWGAGAKGVTFLHLLDPDGSRVDCVVDINRRKQGKFVPGTGHAIVGIGELRARGIRNAVVLNENYVAEIKAAILDAGLDITVHTDAS